MVFVNIESAFMLPQKKTILFIVALLTSFVNFAQKKIMPPPYERFYKTSDLGLGVGSSQYFGDIHAFNNQFSYTSTTRWNANISFTRHLNPSYSVRIIATYTRIMADDYLSTKNKVDGISNKYDNQFLRNSHFRNDIKEISLQTLFNLKNAFYSIRNENRINITPYLIAGIGVYHHAPKAREMYNFTDKKLGAWIPLNTTNWVNSFNLSIPLGLGIRKKINTKLDFAAEICYRITFSDQLDDIISESYPNSTNPLVNRSQERYSALSSEDRSTLFNLVANRQGFPTFSGTGEKFPPIIGYPNETPKRGETGNDAFLTTTLQIRYYFDKKTICPK